MNDFNLSILDIFIIAGVTLLVVVIGLIAARKVKKTSNDYFLASGNMPWYLIGAAFVSTAATSEAMIGTTGATYKSGLGIANWEWWGLPTYSLTMLFFIPMYLRNKITTVPELLNRRFGPVCRNIYSIVILFGYLIIFLPPIIYSGSITVSELTGWNHYYIMAGLIVVTGSYTILGGLTSVMWTDAIQCVLLVGGGVLFFLVALDHIPGGWPAMEAATPERFHLYHLPSDPDSPFLGLIVGSLGAFLFYQSSNQVMIQRILAAKSTWHGIMGMIFAGFINLVRPMVTCLIGVIVYHWLEVMHKGPSLLPYDQDRAFPYALNTFAPSGLKGIILAGFFAAVMASTSALANSIATIFTLDVYRNFWRKNATDKEMITVGRISAAAALVIACVLAPLSGSVGLFKYFQIGVTYMATPFIAVILMGIFWKRTSYAGAIAGLVGGVIIQTGVALAVYLLDIQLHWLYVGGIAEALIILLIIIVSLRTKAPAYEQVKPFIWRPSWLSTLNDGIKRPWWKRIGFWATLYALAACYIYWRFW